MKKTIKTNIIAVCTLSVISLLSINVSALDYQKTINVGFNVQDTLTVSLSSPNLIIDDLMPGTASDSNIITVNVLSNNPYGYTLTSNVGNDTAFDTDELRHSTSATATPFSTITAGTTVSDLSGFTNYQWGYSYSLDGGTTWINANITEGVHNTGYSGLPLYSAGEATLNEKTTTSAAAGDNIQFKIAAKASDTQLAGEYKNIINFILTGNPEPKTYMQDLDSASLATLLPNVGDTATVYDNRDEEEYLIGKLADNKYWMLDNLRLDPTAVDLATLQGNTNASDQTLAYLKNGGGSSPYNTAAVANETSGFGQYNQAQVNVDFKDNTAPTTYGSGSGKVGVYYNYCAASAGSYCYSSSSSSGNATEDICPAGWRMPTGGSSGEYQALYAPYSSNVTNFLNALSTPFSGLFFGAQSGLGSGGAFWSSTRADIYMFYMDVSSSEVSQYGGGRDAGLSVRCVAQ